MQWFFALDAWLQALLASLVMYAMTTLGAACVFFSRRPNANVLTVLLGASAGIMIAASFFSLLLPAIEAESTLPTYLTVTLGFFLGGAFLVASDALLSHTQHTFRAIGDKRTALLYFAVTLHNIPEGMAVGVVFAGLLAGNNEITMSGALALTIGIAIQNFPEGAIISLPLKSEGGSKKRAFFYGMASGVVEPLAAGITILLAGVITKLLPGLLAFAAGAMIYVVVEELLPEASEGDHSNISTIGFAVGFLIMMILDVALG